MNILHDEIIETVEFAGVIHLHDMRIGNGRGRTGFTMESFHELVPVRSLRQLGMHDLMATVRSRRSSTAWYTVAMPPSAILLTTRYRPSMT